MNSNKSKGLQYELQAKDFLENQGLSIIEQNYHSRFGEIDLIMHDKDILCFIEVKYRKSLSFGGAADSISYQKQQKIIKTAQSYLMDKRISNQPAMRFDALMLQQTDKGITINWIQNAFYAS